MKHLILGAISAFVCLSTEGVWAAATLPEFKDTIAKSSSHPPVWRFPDLNRMTDADNSRSDGATFGEPSSKGLDRNPANFYSMQERNLKTEATSESHPAHLEDPETNPATGYKSRIIDKRPVLPVVFAGAAITIMKGSPQPQQKSSVQLTPNEATYTWKGDHYEKIEPYGL